MTVYLGFDPGRDKCGVAVMDETRQIFFHQVVLTADVIDTVSSLRQDYDISLLVMGNQTTSLAWQQRLQTELAPPLAIALINERNSTLEARTRYWEMYPPNFAQRLIPQGMRLPPRAIDDIVAILLIERYLTSINV